MFLLKYKLIVSIETTKTITKTRVGSILRN